MNWRMILMDWGWLAIAVPLLGLVGTTIYSIIQDSKGWKKIEGKIGNTEIGSLSNQHKSMEMNVKETIVAETKGIEKSQNRVQTIVDNINKTVIRTEAKYNNLEPNQKEISDKVLSLLADWQNVITENKELKKEIEYLKEQNKTLFNGFPKEVSHPQGMCRA